MSTSATRTGTDIDEIAPGLFRISTAVPPDVMPGGFTFNQFLLLDREPLLFHTGPRRLFPGILASLGQVMDPTRLRWVAFSHVEADESGALNDWLAVAPQAQPLCSQVAAMVSIDDLADRPPRALADGETLCLGRRTVRWVDAPHVPHNMECGYLFDETDRVLLCGDLFSQPGNDVAPITDSPASIWAPSEAMRQVFPFAPVCNAGDIVNRLADLEPRLLACMHGSSFHGDGGALLRQLRDALVAGIPSR